MIEFVSATRLTREEFWEKSALGRSLDRIALADHERFVAGAASGTAAQRERFVAHVAYQNARGLPAVFNPRIEAAPPEQILVFLHDDLWIDDLFVCDQVEAALREFQVVGVSGNVRRTPLQPSWAFRMRENAADWDELDHLRGGIAHGPAPFGKVIRYGPTGAECELLDGVFLAVRAGTLADSGVRFDTRFDFHFYDLDFCRAAREKGLRLGCWPIALTHQSGGNFRDGSWQAAYERYIAKWKS